VKVAEGSKPSPMPQQPTKTNVQPEIFLEGRLSKTECYEGEAIIYTLHLLTRESVRNFEFVEKPDFDGFRKIELPSSRYPKTSKIERNGKLFLDAVVFKTVLFPLRSGSLLISQFTCDAKIKPAQDLNQIIRLKGGDLKVSVLPLPNPIKGFKGSIGSFKAKISPQSIIKTRVQEIFSLEIELEGEGSLSAEPFDIPQSPFFESYPPKISDSFEESNGIYTSRKKVVLSFTPLVEGIRSLGDISFAYFDPKKRSYETLILKFPAIEVIGGGGEKSEKKVSILPPISQPDKSEIQESKFTLKHLILLALPFFFTAIISAFWSFIEKLFLSEDKIKTRALEQKSFKEWKKAKSNLDARKSKEFHSHLRKSIESYIETIIGEPASALTLNMIEEKLKTANVNENKALQIISLLEEIDSSEFSSEKVQKTELKKRLEKAKEIIRSKLRDFKSISLLLFAFMAFLFYAQDSTDILFKKGYEEQIKSNYQEAIKYYKMVEDYGKTYPVLYFNLANAYFESGKISYAILYYKKALKLKPSFTEAQSNLSVSQSLLKSKIAPYELSPLDKFLLFVNIPYLFYFALFFIITGNLIFLLLKIFGFLGRRYILARISIFLMIVGLFMSFFYYQSIILKDEFKEAVVLENCDVYEKPDPTTKTKSSLPEGSIVYLSKTSAGWAKIKWGEGEGYVNASKLGVP
ncbi:MAG: tetratricopeptide repeat protein, partial [Acidobacteria bacterium]|nr:tetratricopeptide repeat protein [Acidobacteriota bacterium]